MDKHLKFIKSKVGDFLSLKGDSIIGKSLEQLGSWEQETLDICKSILKEDSHVIEVGAHIGTHTIPLSHMCKQGSIYAFEMQKPIFQLLNSNIILNKCNNIHTYMEIVLDKDDVEMIGEINYPVMEEYNSGYLSYERIKQTGRYPVNIITLDKKFKDINKLDLIKIDAEGHEIQVLKGSLNLIKKFKPVILTEYDSNKQEIIDMFPEYKFEESNFKYILDYKGYMNLMLVGKPI
jgi:FkbM family methyltransferase